MLLRFKRNYLITNFLNGLINFFLTQIIDIMRNIDDEITFSKIIMRIDALLLTNIKNQN